MVAAGIVILLSSVLAIDAGRQTIEGRWTGSYRIANTWRFFTLDIEPGKTPQGSLRIPADDETLAVGNLQSDGGKVRFRTGPDSDITEFEAVIANDLMSGDLSYPGGKGRFQLLRSRRPAESLWQDYPGQYTIAGKGYLQPHVGDLRSRRRVRSLRSLAREHLVGAPQG